MANHYFGINDFELVKAMKMLNELGLTIEDLK